MGLIKNNISESLNQDPNVGTASDSSLPGDWKDAAAHMPIFYPINKDKRILVQGVLQAVVQSQGLLLEPGNNYIQKVKDTTLEFVRFIEENSK